MKTAFAFLKNGNISNSREKNLGAWLPPSARLRFIRFGLGTLTLDGAFRIVSNRLGLTAKPILLPFAEAAIDVDKPSDLELAEAILKLRS